MRTPLTTFALVWFVALVAFVVLAAFASANDTFRGDVWLTHRIQDIDSEAFARALDWTEDLTDIPAWPALFGLGALALMRVAGWSSALLFLSGMIGRGFNSGLKEIIQRPRPSPDLVEVTDQPSSFSFPSGHAGGSVVLFGLIFYFASIYIPNQRLRLSIQAACLWIIVVTGIERVYSGHHWPSDVLGGVLYGLLVLAALITTHRLVITPRKQ